MIVSRPEKHEAMSRAVFATRNALIEQTRAGELNIAEVCMVVASVFAATLAGAYDEKNREVVLSGLPDVVRTCFPEWERIYSSIRPSVTEAKESLR